jgi:tetratricopeptide (TPR) repeat protein
MQSARCKEDAGDRCRRHSVFLVLTIAVWIAAGQVALGLDTQRTSPPARTVALSQEAKRQFDAPTCQLEKRLFRDVADGRLDEFSPLGAALVASGVENADALRHYLQKAAALVDELRDSDELADDPRQRVEAIFTFMHRRVLYGGYDLAYTDIRRVLDEGRYNCVSATVLFNYLAGELGLDCRGLEMPSHAMSRIFLPDNMLDIETTCPRWSCAIDHPQGQSMARAGVIGAAAAADHAQAQEVSPIQMAAMIYYNRGVDLLGDKRFAEAAAANAKALRLDPRNATARGNLLATLNNWSIELGNTGRFAEAVEMLRQGLALDAKFEPLAQNYVHVHRQWVDHLCGEGRFREALDVLARASAEMPGREYLRTAQNEVRQRQAKSAPQKGQPQPH